MTREFKLLGNLTITEDGHLSPLMKNAKGCALLAYLIVTDKPQSREAVADLLWESTSTAQSLRNLRVLLTRIRPFLPELLISRQTLAFQATPDTIIDLHQFNQVLSSTETVQLEQALFLYAGHLLEDLYIADALRFNEWLLVMREQLWIRVQHVFRQVCEAYSAQEQWHQGIIICRHWLAMDDLNEEAYRWLMQMLVSVGEVAAALQQYEVCRQRLRTELEVEPEAATIELAWQLMERQDELARIQLPSAAADVPPERPPSGELAEPGLLPVNACVPFRRNDSFTGRERDLLQLAELLLPHPETMEMGTRSVAITGMGGLGKTQLAVEFCYRYGRFYPGGVFWMSFANADNVAEEVAAIGSERGLGLFRETEKLSLREQVGRVQRAWQEPISRLLIFDNCEDEGLLAAWLPVTGGCQILLTSRRAHWSRELNVTALSLWALHRPESVWLLQHLAPHLSQTEADEIAAAIGDLPLAIHLAGGFLHRYQQISTTTYLAQLRDQGLLEHPSLQGRGVSYSPTGHDLHVTRTFALSLKQLNYQDEVDMMAKRILSHVACFAPGEPLAQDLVRATVKDSEDFMTTLLIEDGLTRLVSLGFLEREGEESVVLHRLLAAFVIQAVGDEHMAKARTAVENTLLKLLADYLDYAYQTRVLPPVGISPLRYVTDRALASSSAAVTLLTFVLGRYLWAVGEYVDAQKYLRRGLVLATTYDDVYTQGRILAILSRVSFGQGFHQEADWSATEAERLLRQADMPEPDWLIATLTHRGWAQFRMGQSEPSLAATREAWQLSVEIDNPTAMAECLNLLGSIEYFLLSNYETAERHYAEARVLYQQIGNRFSEAIILLNLGESAKTQGDYQRAQSNIQEALTIVRSLDQPITELSILTSLGGAQVGLGDYETAVANLTYVLDHAPKDWTYAPSAYLALAEGYLGQGKAAEALLTLQTADILETSDDPYDVGETWCILGQIAAESGQPVAASVNNERTYTADDCFGRSLQIFKDMNNQRKRALVLRQWATYELAQGNKKHGEKMWQKARVIFEQLNLPTWVVQMQREVKI